MDYETGSTIVIGLFTLLTTFLVLWLIARGGLRKDPRDRGGPE